MKWLLMALVFLPVCALAFLDAVVWNLTHGFGNKTSVPECFREIWGVFERL